MSNLISEQDRQLLDSFLDDLWLHQGVSQHTLAAYKTDLTHFAQYLNAQHLAPLTELHEAEIRRYIQHRQQQGHSQRSIARFISSTRKFYRYLLRTEVRGDDPSAYVQAPNKHATCHSL